LEPEIMTKVQLSTTAKAPTQTKRMYRGIITAQAIADVFVRAISDADANSAIKAGKGQRMKPRFSPWELWQQAIAVEAYTSSKNAVQEISMPGLTLEDLQKIYSQMLHNISVVRRGTYSDRKRQAMTDAVREFYDLLEEAIRAKTLSSKA
jgi:hypothetical protein